jgi:hypothetical protein
MYGSSSRETKLCICRMLIEHADDATASFLNMTVAVAIGWRHCFEILFEAGMEPKSWMLCQAATIACNASMCSWLVKHGVDPFLLERERDGDSNNLDVAAAPSFSPFQLAARHQDTSNLRFFLRLWNERFSHNSGKDTKGNYVIHHLLFRNQHVSLESVKLVMEHSYQEADNDNATLTIDSEEGFFPFALAAISDGNLDVIFHVLKHCPAALFGAALPTP